MNLVIDGNSWRVRPKKTWADCVKEDKKKWRMAGMNPSDRAMEKGYFENATNPWTGICSCNSIK